jgi:hypothetical protein
MALTCPSNVSSTNLGFTEFIDCTTLSISYDILGEATVSFTVVAAQAQPINPQVYTDLTFGGIRFTGYITSLTVRRVAGTIVYEHQYSLNAVGCRV